MTLPLHCWPVSSGYPPLCLSSAIYSSGCVLLAIWQLPQVADEIIAGSLTRILYVTQRTQLLFLLVYI